MRKKLEEEDPFELVEAAAPGSDPSYVEAMARTFIDEDLRMGWPDSMILGLFAVPHYRGPYTAYRVLGPEKIHRLLEEAKAGRASGGT